MTLYADDAPSRAEVFARDAASSARDITRWLDAVELIGRPATELICDEWRDAARFVVRNAIETMESTVLCLQELDGLLAQLGDDYVEEEVASGVVTHG